MLCYAHSAMGKMLRFLVLAASLIVLIPACAHLYLDPVVSKVEKKKIVRVNLEEVGDDILKFKVTNLSEEPLVVLRDEAVIETPFGALRRPPGGIGTVVKLEPGKTQRVYLKYEIRGLEFGDEVRVRWDRAILLHDAPVAVDPIVLLVGR